MQRSESNLDGWRWLEFRSAGDHSELCYCKRTSAGIVGQMLMEGISFEVARLHREMIQETYRNLNWQAGSVDKVYSHQAGKRPHVFATKLAKVPSERAPFTYDKYGNLTSATMPVNMFLNRPSPRDRILFLGAGSGISVCQGGLVF